MGQVDTDRTKNIAALDKRTRRIFEIEWPKVRVRLTGYQLALMRDALQNLVGEPLTNMIRLSTAQYLRLGVQRPYKNLRGEDVTQSDWGLMIGGSCHWCFKGPDEFSLGKDDFGPESQRRDEYAKPFYSRLNKDSIVVESVEVLNNGTQVLTFSDEYSLTIRLPEYVSRYSEPWRFMTPRHDFRGHLVLGEFALQWSFRLPGMKHTRCAGLKWRRMDIKSHPGKRNRNKFTRASRANYSRRYKRLPKSGHS